LRFLFKGKSGKTWRLSVRNRRVAKIMRACQELPGQQLFQYLDEDGEARRVSSSDVNTYLREASGRDITAKYFRTWAATVEAAIAFHAIEGVPLKKHVGEVVMQVAEKLGNTPTICRKCYIHPAIIDACENGTLSLGKHIDHEEDRGPGLDRAVLRFLKSRDEILTKA